MEIISNTTDLLAQAGIDSPKLDAQLLFMHAAGITREEWLTVGDITLNDQQLAQYHALVERRAKREPMSHILGAREFYGREFTVTKDVLDPRPDTETLVDGVLQYCPPRLRGGQKGGQSVGCSDTIESPPLHPPRKRGGDILPATSHQPPITILDIGTGSGCIIITLLKEIESAEGLAIDVSEAALKVARENAQNHQVEGRLELFQQSLFELHSNNNGLKNKSFDIIISNPPYIPTSALPTLMPEVSKYEPQLALDGGKDGLDCYESLAKSTAQLLKANGLIFLEIGAGQREDVVRIFTAHSWQLVDVRCDLAGHERCVIFTPKH